MNNSFTVDDSWEGILYLFSLSTGVYHRAYGCSEECSSEFWLFRNSGKWALFLENSWIRALFLQNSWKWALFLENSWKWALFLENSWMWALILKIWIFRFLVYRKAFSFWFIQRKKIWKQKPSHRNRKCAKNCAKFGLFWKSVK